MESESLIDLLLIEDDVRLADLTREYLEGHGIIVTLEKNGEQGLQQALRHRFDLVLLDLMLPDRDGISICQRLREHSDVPVIMITARGEEADRVLGLEIGADDYIYKPFSPRELLARVRSTVRRARGQSRPRTALVTAGDLILDPGPLTARLNGQQLDLTISISAKHPARSRFNIGKPLFMIFSARWKSDSTATTREDLYA